MKTEIKEIENETETLTVSQLRNQGYTVSINHLRRVKGAPGVLAQKWNIHNRDMIAPKGGATEARIKAPDGRTATGVARVFWKDTYNRKSGIHYALKFALQNLEN